MTVKSSMWNPKQSGQKLEAKKHRTEWCAAASKCRCTTCGIRRESGCETCENAVEVVKGPRWLVKDSNHKLKRWEQGAFGRARHGAKSGSSMARLCSGAESVRVMRGPVWDRC